MFNWTHNKSLIGPTINSATVKGFPKQLIPAPLGLIPALPSSLGTPESFSGSLVQRPSLWTKIC